MVKILFYLLLDRILHLSFWSYGGKIVQRQYPEDIGPLEDINAGPFSGLRPGNGPLRRHSRSDRDREKLTGI